MFNLPGNIQEIIRKLRLQGKIANTAQSPSNSVSNTSAPQVLQGNPALGRSQRMMQLLRARNNPRGNRQSQFIVGSGNSTAITGNSTATAISGSSSAITGDQINNQGYNQKPSPYRPRTGGPVTVNPELYARREIPGRTGDDPYGTGVSLIDDQRMRAAVEPERQMVDDPNVPTQDEQAQDRLPSRRWQRSDSDNNAGGYQRRITPLVQRTSRPALWNPHSSRYDSGFGTYRRVSNTPRRSSSTYGLADQSRGNPTQQTWYIPRHGTIKFDIRGNNPRPVYYNGVRVN